MKFHRFFTGAPQCVPSRATLMTGRSPVAARMTRFSAPLPRDEITLPELLRDKGGYFTGICGRSFHLDGSAKVGAAAARLPGARIEDLHRPRGLAEPMRRQRSRRTSRRSSSTRSRRTSPSSCGRTSATRITRGTRPPSSAPIPPRSSCRPTGPICPACASSSPTTAPR
jgi:hypothetical protein